MFKRESKKITQNNDHMACVEKKILAVPEVNAAKSLLLLTE
jgi:hypothetical protein